MFMVNRQLQNLEGFVKWFNGIEGVIVQTGPVRADGTKPMRKDKKPYEHHLYIADVQASGIPEAEIQDQKNIFVFDTQDDTQHTSGVPRTKAVNLRRKSEAAKGAKDAKPVLGFVVDSLGPDHFEIVPNHPEGKAKSFKIFANGPAVSKAKFKVVSGKQLNQSNEILEIEATGKSIEVEVEYPLDSVDLTVMCSELGTKDFLTLWED